MGKKKTKKRRITELEQQKLNETIQNLRRATYFLHEEDIECMQKSIIDNQFANYLEDEDRIEYEELTPLARKILFERIRSSEATQRMLTEEIDNLKKTVANLLNIPINKYGLWARK